MKKSDWQYLVITLLFICIGGITVIGFLMGLVIPKGSQASASTEYFLGLHRHQWGNIHFYFSIAFVCLIMIHLILNWRWIKGKARQLFHRGWWTMLVLTAIVSLLALGLFWTFYPRQPGTYEGYGVKGRGRAGTEAFKKGQYLQEEKVSIGEAHENIGIIGQMTLLDVEKATGIPAREIAHELDLPSKVSLDETLGKLRKKYSFTIKEVRDVVTELLNKKDFLAQEKKEAEEPQIIKEQEIKEVRTKKLLHGKQKQRLVRGRVAAVPSGIIITGQMTLYDLEDIIGIPARKIADELGIPSGVPLYEHLGRLRKRYLFTMQEVRDVVVSLMKKDRKEK